MLDRKNLQDALERGAQRLIAKKAGRSPQAVTDWFSGRRNSKVIEAAALLVLSEQVRRRVTEAQQFSSQVESALRGDIL